MVKVKEAKYYYMVKEDLTSVDGHTIQYIGDASQKYTLESI